jgi:hypothetical protein
MEWKAETPRKAAVAGVDVVWKREKPEVGKELENRAESHMSGAHGVTRM